MRSSPPPCPATPIFPARHPIRRPPACPEAWRRLVAIFRPSFFVAVAPPAPILSRRAAGFPFLFSGWQESVFFLPRSCAPTPWPPGGSLFGPPTPPFSAPTHYPAPLAA